jgi:replicative DNA helicase
VSDSRENALVGAEGALRAVSKSIAWPAKAPVWRVETDLGPIEATSSLAVLRGLEQLVEEGQVHSFKPLPTGFEALDRRLAGGLHLGELVLVGGAQGVGKTMMALQMARNIAASGEATCMYVCFEHDEIALLVRLLSQESIDPTVEEYQIGLRTRDIEARVVESLGIAGRDFLSSLASDSRGERTLLSFASYSDRLLLMKGSSVRTTVDALQKMVEQHRDGRIVLFVDYLQKVPVYPESSEEAEKVTRVVEALKELALSLGIVVVAVVAADREGLKAQRLRLHHLRGSSALSYEADVILILNEKYRIVTKTSIEYNPHRAQAFREWLVCSIEKNRSARDQIDIEFQKRFEYSCLNPRGGDVQEQLIEERLYTE